MSYTYICIRYYIFLLLLLERWICRVSIPHLFFSFGHCSICPTFTTSDYPFGILNLYFHKYEDRTNCIYNFFQIFITSKILFWFYQKFSETDIINMLDFFIDNIFVFLGGRNFQQTVAIPMGTNCAPLLADLFLYSYEADFIQGPLQKSEKKLARSFNCMLRYIDDVP